ncbi:PIN domain-like protein [Trametes coccinea BRFM310]|uniref:U three protein 23 n=1 Tax=Trametes coccinea (strain BRFM310) TaxID=1353009 RepID=A0A1Y2ITI9_TRAC3|nr:PIN domain-like protein [Trametes coccinea BRFM310]
MRQKRAKAYRKLMSLYALSFGFRQPYQVLVDSHMCKEAVAHKIELVKQLGVVLQGTVKPMITQCCIHELYLQGKEQQPAVDLAKTFERRKCNHREAIPGDDCISSVVGETNKHRYVIASHSQELRQKLRAIPGVPIVHMNRSVMILEPPSDATLRVKALSEEKALHASEPEVAKLPAPAPQEPPKKKKKGPKGPNPLSVKKKKPKSEGAASPKKKTEEESKAQTGDKRKRDSDNAEAISSAPRPEGTGHKRKRRRKHGSGSASGGGQPPTQSTDE